MADQPDKKLYFLSSKTVKRLEALAELMELVPDPVQFETLVRAGKKHFRMRPQGRDASGRLASIVYPPFYPTRIFDDAGTWKVEMQPGYLEYQNIGASALPLGVLGYLIPNIGATSMEATPRPALALSGLACKVYLKVETSDKGVPVPESVEVIASSSAMPSTHHVPPPGAVAGEYYFLLFETESDGETVPSPRVLRALPGNKQIPNQLIEIKQIGGEVELFKSYDETADYHEVRTLKALEGGSGGVSVLQVLEEPEDTVNFKWVGPTSPTQINVEASGDEGIIVRGNGQSGIFNWLDCDEMPVVNFQVSDGMISSATGGDAILGDCGGGTGDPETTEV